MKRQERIEELTKAMKSFTKENYQKEELLPEMLELQRELITLTFNDTHAEQGKLRIWDVEDHLKKLNEERGHVADVELAAFVEGSKILCNTIKAEMSGNAGEFKAFRSIETIRSIIFCNRFSTPIIRNLPYKTHCISTYGCSCGIQSSISI